MKQYCTSVVDLTFVGKVLNETKSILFKLYGLNEAFPAKVLGVGTW